MSNEPTVQVGDVCIQTDTAANPFDKVYARVLAIKNGYVQYSTGADPEYCPRGPKSTTLAKFMEKFSLP
jgi:hypothetical protein